MKVRYILETSPLMLTKNKVYEVISIEKGWYRIVDDTHEDYLYPPEMFEVIDGTEDDAEEEQNKKCIRNGSVNADEK